MEPSVFDLIQYCSSRPFIFKFIAPNDTGVTNSHQSGIYMQRRFWPLFFSTEGIKGENRDKYFEIRWPDGTTTESRFIWYGKGTRSEYRLTRGITGIIEPSDIGSLFILVKEDEGNYCGQILSTEDDIEYFLSYFNPYRDIRGGYVSSDGPVLIPLPDCYESCISRVADGQDGFPSTSKMALYARKIAAKCGCSAIPDDRLLKWRETEFGLFSEIEQRSVMSRLNQPFKSVTEFVAFANSVVNTRKSRSGKSLENHLAAVFDEHTLPYSFNPVTEGNKRPDFIFPGEKQYHDASYPEEKLIFLASKTTCKDRWRQVLNEAERIPDKYLFTLQEGISEVQLEEMEDSHVQLIVPRTYKKEFYPKNYSDSILTLENFIGVVRETLELSS